MCECHVSHGCLSNIKDKHHYLTHPHLPPGKMAAISQTILSDAFAWMTVLYFYYNFADVFLHKGPIDNNPNKDFAPIHWRIYSALGGDE